MEDWGVEPVLGLAGKGREGGWSGEIRIEDDASSLCLFPPFALTSSYS